MKKKSVQFFLHILLIIFFVGLTYKATVYPKVSVGETITLDAFSFTTETDEPAFIEFASAERFTVLADGVSVEAERYEVSPVWTEYQYHFECECSEVIIADSSVTVRADQTLQGKDLTPLNNQAMAVIAFAFLTVVAWVFVYKL